MCHMYSQLWTDYMCTAVLVFFIHSFLECPVSPKTFGISKGVRVCAYDETDGCDPLHCLRRVGQGDCRFYILSLGIGGRRERFCLSGYRCGHVESVPTMLASLTYISLIQARVILKGGTLNWENVSIRSGCRAFS